MYPLLFHRVDPFENRPSLEDGAAALSVGQESSASVDDDASTGKTTHIHLAMWVCMWLVCFCVLCYVIVEYGVKWSCNRPNSSVRLMLRFSITNSAYNIHITDSCHH